MEDLNNKIQDDEIDLKTFFRTVKEEFHYIHNPYYFSVNSIFIFKKANLYGVSIWLYKTNPLNLYVAKFMVI